MRIISVNSKERWIVFCWSRGIDHPARPGDCAPSPSALEHSSSGWGRGKGQVGRAGWEQVSPELGRSCRCGQKVWSRPLDRPLTSLLPRHPPVGTSRKQMEKVSQWAPHVERTFNDLKKNKDRLLLVNYVVTLNNLCKKGRINVLPSPLFLTSFPNNGFVPSILQGCLWIVKIITSS